MIKRGQFGLGASPESIKCNLCSMQVDRIDPELTNEEWAQFVFDFMTVHVKECGD